MNLVDVIESLVEEKGLDRDQVTEIVCEGIKAAYQKKFPTVEFVVEFNKRQGQLDIFAKKEIVSAVEDNDLQVSVRKAKMLVPDAVVGDCIPVPFEEQVGRIEILTARQTIASKIRGLEQLAVYEEFKEKEGTIVTAMIHKKERAGFAVKLGDVMALLPKENFIATDNLRVGFQVKALLREVLKTARQDYQLILDRSSAEFVQKLIELEIPEVFEGLVEVKRIVRKPGYKTKAIVFSRSKEIDPVGTCVGIGGVRIKPILRELGQEKIDLIEWTDVLEDLVRGSLKPAEIDKVSVNEAEGTATVWLVQDQRSLAIGKMGQNITLASKLVGLEIQLQDLTQSGDAQRGINPEFNSEFAERSHDSQDDMRLDINEDILNEAASMPKNKKKRDKHESDLEEEDFK